jgi:hypothetical protein
VGSAAHERPAASRCSTVVGVRDVEISDEELTALALAADPDIELAEDAVPFGGGDVAGDAVLLPAWYMPMPSARGGGRGRRLVIAAVVAALLVVSGAGLCVTYGVPQIAMVFVL